jgi:uncharacterized membrane protein
MHNNPQYWQYIGGLVGALVTICMGIYIIVFGPKKIERRVSSGAMTADAAQRLRKTIRWTGPLLVVGGLVFFIARLLHWT